MSELPVETQTEEVFPILELSEEYQEQNKWYNLTPNLKDAYVADQIAGRYSDLLRYCTGLNWLKYTGSVWKVDAIHEALIVAESVVREMVDEANQIGDPKLAGQAIAQAAQYLNEYKLCQALKAAERKMLMEYDTFDQKPYLLNLQNGIMDLKTMSFGEHRREFYLTKQAPVRYNAEASCPRWNEFIYEVMGGNETLMKFLQRAIGYALTGKTSERVFFILYGTGFNGKTTFLETILALMGEQQYALATPVETFMLAWNAGGVPNDIARLRSSRFVYATEGELGQRLAESRIKRMTGQDTISARFLYKEFFDFKPKCKLFLGTNHKPKIKGTDEAIWDRIRLIPFTQCFRDNPDDNLGDKLRQELTGILNWALEGCEIWQQEGLGCPDEIRDATSEYRVEMDILGGFIEDRCILERGKKCQVTPIFNAYRNWCEENGEKPLNRSGFSAAMEERGLYKDKAMAGWFWHGIQLK